MFDLEHKLAKTFFYSATKRNKKQKNNFLIFFYQAAIEKHVKKLFPFLWMTVAALSRNRPIRPIRRLGFFLLK